MVVGQSILISITTFHNWLPEILTKNVFHIVNCLNIHVEYTNKLIISFPCLSTLAITYLAAHVSSAPVERIFSVGGKIFPPDRCCLSDTTFQHLMFIKLNKHYCHLMFNIEQNMFRVIKGIQLTLFAYHESTIEYIYYCYNCYYTIK